MGSEGGILGGFFGGEGVRGDRRGEMGVRRGDMGFGGGVRRERRGVVGIGGGEGGIWGIGGEIRGEMGSGDLIWD